MDCAIPDRRSASTTSPAARLPALAAVLLLIGSLSLLIGQPETVSAHAAQPRAQSIAADVTPTPRPPRPQINPVSPNDDTVVRPDAATDDVNGLPASGIGVTNPADADIQRWTTFAIAALGLNAVALFGVAIWSLRRRRI